METLIKWKDESGKWIEFDQENINDLTVEHVVNLFSNKVEVVIKEGQNYIVNSLELFETCKETNRPAIMIKDVDQERWGKTFGQVGLTR